MRMRRFSLRALIAAALIAGACALPPAALAGPGVCDGKVIATGETVVWAASDAVVDSIDVLPGQVVAPGEALMTLRTEKVFAQEDGQVASVDVVEGECADGGVLEVAPLSRYVIYCSVKDAYKEPDNMLPRMGQTLYAKCKSDGSHRAVARVTGIDGDAFTLETLGGALYVGEVVYLYETSEFGSAGRVGIGTVVSSAPREYQASGCITRMCVEVGDTVERGQLLYEYLPGTGIAPGQSALLTSATGGIVTSISAAAGQALSSDSPALTLAPAEGLRISVLLDEEDAASVREGARVSLLLPWQEYEDASGGVIESVSRVSEGTASAGQAYAGSVGMDDMSDMSAGAAMSGMSGMGSASAMSGMPGMGDASAMSGMSGMGSASAMSGMSGMGNASAMSGMSGMGDASAMSGMSGMGSASAMSNATGTNTTSAMSAADASAPAVSEDAQYEVVIRADDISQLRIGMTITVAFVG